MEEVKTTVWITKYALTTGIMKREVFACGDEMIKHKESKDHTDQYFHKGDWFTSKKEADVKAEEMRLKKIKSLEKQLAKYKEISFK